jgi:hypothetical protein
MKNMKTFWLTILGAIISSGCTPKDAIDRVVQQESSSPAFRNEPFKKINLPVTAPINEVITQAFEKTFPLPTHVGNINVITQRSVNIKGDLYTAILVETESGQKVVLLRYEPTIQSWWNGVYNQ